MEIRKLTIQPINRGIKSYISQNPSSEVAGMLIKEKLETASQNIYNKTSARIFRKMPKFLKGFVNPKTLVSAERNFY